MVDQGHEDLDSEGRECAELSTEGENLYHGCVVCADEEATGEGKPEKMDADGHSGANE